MASMDAVGSDADDRYQALVRSAGGARLEYAKNLRTLYEGTSNPAARWKVLYLLGDLGGEDDVDFLVDVALAKTQRPTPAARVTSGDDHAPSAMEEDYMRQTAAAGAVVRISRNDRGARADAAVDKVLAEADQDVTIATIIDLQFGGGLTPSRIQQLAARGITAPLKQVDNHVGIRLDQENSTHRRPAVVPPKR